MMVLWLRCPLCTPHPFIIIDYFSKCNSSHYKASDKTEETVREILPVLFQGHLLCAGSNVGRRGSCKGDSGGPLVLFDHSKDAFVQIAMVQGKNRCMLGGRCRGYLWFFKISRWGFIFWAKNSKGVKNSFSYMGLYKVHQ